MAFIPSRIKQHVTDAGNAKLNLTSMMDMFTVILLFLLKVYSTEGQLIQPSKFLTLPNSTIEKSPKVALNISASRDWVAVNDKPIVKVEDIVGMKGLIISPLQKELLKYATEAQKMRELYGHSFSGMVTIQGDKSLPYNVLVRIMATCGKSQYPNMRLLVYQKES